MISGDDLVQRGWYHVSVVIKDQPSSLSEVVNKQLFFGPRAILRYGGLSSSGPFGRKRMVFFWMCDSDCLILLSVHVTRNTYLMPRHETLASEKDCAGP